CGIKRATVLSSTAELITESLFNPSWARSQVDVTVQARPEGPVKAEHIVEVWPDATQLLLVLRGNTVFDHRLLRLLLTQVSTAALVDSSVPVEFEPLVASAENTSAGKFCGAAVLQYEWASTQNGSFDRDLCEGLDHGAVVALNVAAQYFYDPALRRKLRPFWFPAPSASNTRLAEGVLLDSVQKGSLDLPARIHAPIEKFLISHLCKTSITAHQLTIAWIVIACVITVLFALGHLIWGIGLALIVGILDGLDGKQARVKVETSESGKLEHRFDSLFEVAWPS